MSFQKYLDVVSGNFRKAVKVEWLNHDESVAFEFTDALYDINVDLSVNYQNGSRRTCTLTLNNNRNQFPINFNNIWLGQKFKLWMGVYIDDKTPYLFPQGVFFVSNPNDIYQPSTKTIKINGVDKWAFLDGTLHGKLMGTYQTNIGVSLYDSTRELLKQPRTEPRTPVTNEDIEKYFEIENDECCFEYNNNAYTSTFQDPIPTAGSVAKTTLKAKKDIILSFQYYYKIYAYPTSHFQIKIDDQLFFNMKHDGTGEDRDYSKIAYEKLQSFPTTYIRAGQRIEFAFTKRYTYYRNISYAQFLNIFIDLPIDNCVDPVQPFISPVFLNKTTTVKNEEVEVWKCPYTAKVERGKTYADVLLEYATILCAHVYYDVNGRLVMEPMIDTADDITDTNKEVFWHYTVDEKTLLGLSQTYNFDKVYNDIIVLGNISNGYQFKARVQNRNPMSDTCIQKIGLKTKDPFEDNQYYSDEQCKELAMYYAKVDTILQKSGNIDSTPLYHLDVNKIVSISTPNNNMSKELFLVTGFTLNSSGSMSVNVASINILKDFSIVEADVYG